MIDVGRKIVTHQIRGFLAGQTVYFLLNFHLSARQIWITRHGESLDNVAGKIGGDASLSEEGRRYAKALTEFIDSKLGLQCVLLRLLNKFRTTDTFLPAPARKALSGPPPAACR